MKLLFFDLETTGDKPEKDDVLEFAGAIYDTDARRVVQTASCVIEPLVDHGDPMPFQELHGISRDLAAWSGVKTEVALREIRRFFFVSDYCVAHNGREFDVPMLKGWEKRVRADGDEISFPPLIDPRTDFPRSMYTIRCRSQAHMLAERGIANPFPHNAMSDVLAMIRLFQFADFKETLKISKSPELKVVAKTTYEQRELAKAAGFQWDGEKKVWFKLTKEIFLEEDLGKVNFEYVIWKDGERYEWSHGAGAGAAETCGNESEAGGAAKAADGSYPLAKETPLPAEELR